jgi:CBS domain pair.
MMRVQEFVDTHAPYLHADATLQDAVDKLDLYKATALPVLDEDGTVVGLLPSSRCLTRCLQSGASPASRFLCRALRRFAPTRTPVKTRPSRSG